MGALAQHSTNPAQMVREIHRVLKPGRQAIIMTVNRHSWLNVMHNVMKVETDHLEAPVFRPYTIHEFRKLLASIGTCRSLRSGFPSAPRYMNA